MRNTRKGGETGIVGLCDLFSGIPEKSNLRSGPPLSSFAHLAYFAVKNRQGLFEIVNDHFLAAPLENLLDKINVRRVVLVIVLRLFAWENQVQRHLIRLIDDGAMAGRHFSDVKIQHSRDRAQIFLGSGDKFIGGLRILRVGPKNYNV